MSVRIRSITVAVLMVLSASALSQGDGKTPSPTDLQTALQGVAKEIHDVLQRAGPGAVAIGEFTGPPAPQSSAGAMIQAALVKALEKAGVTVKGQFLPLSTPEHRNELIVKLIIEVRNLSDGDRIHELVRKVGFDSRAGTGGPTPNLDVAKLLGVNYDGQGRPQIVPEDQARKLREAYSNPPLQLDETKIKVSKTSTYAVEVLTQPAGGASALKAKRPRNVKGVPFVEIGKGEEYQLRLHNTSELEAAVTITIDGVDALHFFEPAKGQKKPGSFLVGAKGQRTIRGWRRNPETVNAFLVGSFADSAAAKVLSSSRQVGTITVCFHPCWEKDATPARYKNARSAAGEATGLGREIKDKSRLVERTIGPVEAIVSIRYNKKPF